MKLQGWARRSAPHERLECKRLTIQATKTPEITMTKKMPEFMHYRQNPLPRLAIKQKQNSLKYL